MSKLPPVVETRLKELPQGLRDHVERAREVGHELALRHGVDATRRVEMLRQELFHHGQTQATLTHNLAAIRLQTRAEQFQQRRFPRTVVPGKANSFTTGDRKRQIVEQAPVTRTVRYGLCLQQCSHVGNLTTRPG